MTFRTDRNNNPAAFTTDIAKEAGLIEGRDYQAGESFNNGKFKTAHLLHDPIELTIKVIDKIGFFTKTGTDRWLYVPNLVMAMWEMLSYEQKTRIVALMYKHEGGTALQELFTTPLEISVGDKIDLEERLS